MIYINGEEVKPYLGDYKPLTIYKGTEKLAGWVENTTEISSNIRIENGYSTMKVKPFGKSEQVQTEQGKNLLPFKDINFTLKGVNFYTENGNLYLNGASTGEILTSDNAYITYFSFILPVGTYKFKHFSSLNINMAIQLKNVSDKSELASINLNSNTVKTFTLNEETEVYLGIYIYNQNFNSENLKLMLSIEDATEYEPSIPDSPSPNYPSKIENVSGDLEVKATARNILPRTFAEDLLKRLNVSSLDNYLVEVNGKNYFKYPAQLGYRTGKNYFIKDVFKENTQYVFKLAIMKNNSETSVAYNIQIKYKDGTIIAYNNGSRYWTNMTEEEATIISDENKTIEEIGISYNSGITYINLDKYILCKLEAGMDTNKIEYEPYKEQSITFPLGTQKLMKDGYLGESGVVNKRKQIVLTGQENFVVSGKAFRYDIEGAYALPSTSPEVTNGTIDYLMCNAFKVAGQSLMYRDGKTGISLFVPTDNPEKQRIMIGYEGKTVVELKEWLAEQYTNGTPVIIEYETQEEEITTYTTEQQTAYNALQALKTYRTITNISNNQDTNMEITYKNNT